jgi:hypothetical protein
MYGSNVEEYIGEDSGWKVKGRNVKGQIVKEKRKDTVERFVGWNVTR